MEMLFDFLFEQERGRQLSTVQAALDDAIRAGDEDATSSLRQKWLTLKAVDPSKLERPGDNATSEQMKEAAVAAAEPVDPNPQPVPGEVSSGQLIIALAELDWLDAVDAAVAQADALSVRLWARASRFPRNDAMVIAICTAIGKDSDDLDTLFRLAATK